jgi:hypothetical protein
MGRFLLEQPMRKSSLLAAAFMAAVASTGFSALPSSAFTGVVPNRSKRKLASWKQSKDPLAKERAIHNEAVEQRKKERLARRQAKRMNGMTEVV